jgi:hypothetical protein
VTYTVRTSRLNPLEHGTLCLFETRKALETLAKTDTLHSLPEKPASTG